MVKEESLCETLLKLGVPTSETSDKDDNDGDDTKIDEKKSTNSRDIESYEFKNAKLDDALFKKRRRRSFPTSKRPVNQRLTSSVSHNQMKSRPHIPVTELDSDDAVVLAIVRVLREPKTNIISKSRFL